MWPPGKRVRPRGQRRQQKRIKFNFMTFVYFVVVVVVVVACQSALHLRDMLLLVCACVWLLAVIIKQQDNNNNSNKLFITFATLAPTLLHATCCQSPSRPVLAIKH